MLVEIGSVAKGTVEKVVPYGAIVRIEGGQTGLVHISEIADTFVSQVSDYLNEGDSVLVKVVGISGKGRYELSVKRVTSEDYARHGLTPRSVPAPVAARPREASRAPAHRGGREDFEKKLSAFLKESEERLAPLREAATARRGRRKSKKSASSPGSF